MRTQMLKTFLCLASVVFGMAQTPAPAPVKPVPAKPVAVKAVAKPSRVDEVIQLFKGGMTEGFIVKTLQKTNKAIELTTADVMKLKSAGVSENIMNTMMDPGVAPAPVVAVTTTVAPAPVVESAPAPVPAPVNTAPASIVAVSLPSGPPTAAQKKRVVVDAFDFSAVMTVVQAVFGTQQNIGKGIQAMLTTRLHQANKLVIVDRAKVGQVMAEQDFTAGNRAKQGSGARIGRISGADVILAGDIIIFGRDDKKKSGAVAAMAGFCKLCGAVAASKKEEKAVVSITYRLIDAETTEVIATGEARGESLRKSTNWGAMIGSLGNGGVAAAVDMSSTNFAETIIGEATQDCVNKLADILTKQAQDMKKHVREVEAFVADVAGNSLTITAGADDGVNVGELFDILHVDREVKDPVTKEVLDRITSKVGEMTISGARPKTSSGTYSGSAIQAGKDFIARKRM